MTYAEESFFICFCHSSVIFHPLFSTWSRWTFAILKTWACFVLLDIIDRFGFRNVLVLTAVVWYVRMIKNDLRQNIQKFSFIVWVALETSMMPAFFQAKQSQFARFEICYLIIMVIYSSIASGIMIWVSITTSFCLNL